MKYEDLKKLEKASADTLRPIYEMGIDPELKQVKDGKQAIPTPGRTFGHLEGNRDDWPLVQMVQDGQLDPQYVRYVRRCVGCGVGQEMVESKLYFDSTMKWLCDDCRGHGFVWGSQIGDSGDTFVQYQLVRRFDDDTLFRHLKFSPNPRDPVHKGFNPEDNRRVQVQKPPSALDNIT